MRNPLTGEYEYIILKLSAKLSDTKLIRSRTAYSFITLISEVSGFADIFIVGSTFWLGTYYTSLLQKQNLSEDLNTLHLLKKKKNKKPPKPQLNDKLFDTNMLKLTFKHFS